MRILVAVAVLTLAACSSPEEIEADQEERQAAIEDDVALETCATDPGSGFMVATVKVTNNSSDPSTYTVEIAFESEDGATQYGTGTAFVNELQNGQSTTVEANSLDEPAGTFKCRVADVSRFASS